ncbi:MAG TPA: MinD/ParA family protein [Steroidobacteraceae bacterium]|jgi:flagellar biosynthesis protein FlhG
MPQPDARATLQPAAPVQVIAVTGGKGGTGKTAVSINLATAFARAGRNTMLLDGDLGLANVDVLLGLTPRCTLEQLLSGERTLEEIILETESGVRIVPAASGVARMANLNASEQAAIVRAFSHWPGQLDVLIVDTAPGINPSVLQFCQAAQQVLLVLRDEPTSLTDAYALIKVLSRNHGVRSFRVLANMIRRAGQGEAVFRRLQRVTDRYLDVALEYAGEIPEDGALTKAVQAQRPVLEAFPLSPAAQAFTRIASAAQRWPVQDGPSGRVEFFLERMLRRAPVRLKVLK